MIPNIFKKSSIWNLVIGEIFLPLPGCNIQGDIELKKRKMSGRQKFIIFLQSFDFFSSYIEGKIIHVGLKFLGTVNLAMPFYLDSHFCSLIRE